MVPCPGGALYLWCRWQLKRYNFRTVQFLILTLWNKHVHWNLSHSRLSFIARHVPRKERERSRRCHRHWSEPEWCPSRTCRNPSQSSPCRKTTSQSAHRWINLMKRELWKTGFFGRKRSSDGFWTTLSPNSFNFMQFLVKFGYIVCWRPGPPPPPLGGLACPPRGNPGSATEIWLDSHEDDISDGCWRCNPFGRDEGLILAVIVRYTVLQHNSGFSQTHKIGNIGIIANSAYLHISTYLQFPPPFATYDVSKYKIRYQWIE